MKGLRNKIRNLKYKEEDFSFNNDASRISINDTMITDNSLLNLNMNIDEEDTPMDYKSIQPIIIENKSSNFQNKCYNKQNINHESYDFIDKNRINKQQQINDDYNSNKESFKIQNIKNTVGHNCNNQNKLIEFDSSNHHSSKSKSNKKEIQKKETLIKSDNTFHNTHKIIANSKISLNNNNKMNDLGMKEKEILELLAMTDNFIRNMEKNPEYINFNNTSNVSISKSNEKNIDNKKEKEEDILINRNKLSTNSCLKTINRNFDFDECSTLIKEYRDDVKLKMKPKFNKESHRKNYSVDRYKNNGLETSSNNNFQSCDNSFINSNIQSNSNLIEINSNSVNSINEIKYKKERKINSKISLNINQNGDISQNNSNNHIFLPSTDVFSNDKNTSNKQQTRISEQIKLVKKYEKQLKEKNLTIEYLTKEVNKLNNKLNSISSIENVELSNLKKIVSEKSNQEREFKEKELLYKQDIALLDKTKVKLNEMLILNVKIKNTVKELEKENLNLLRRNLKLENIIVNINQDKDFNMYNLDNVDNLNNIIHNDINKIESKSSKFTKSDILKLNSFDVKVDGIFNEDEDGNYIKNINNDTSRFIYRKFKDQNNGNTNNSMLTNFNFSIYSNKKLSSIMKNKSLKSTSEICQICSLSNTVKEGCSNIDLISKNYFIDSNSSKLNCNSCLSVNLKIKEVIKFIHKILSSSIEKTQLVSVFLGKLNEKS